MFNTRVQRAVAERSLGFWVSWQEEEVALSMTTVTERTCTPKSTAKRPDWIEHQSHYDGDSRCGMLGHLCANSTVLDDYIDVASN
jgi:hypothetical protein